MIEWKCIPTDGGASFGKWFWAYRPSIEAFLDCLPLINIDDTHLCGKYNRKLLVTLSNDAEKQKFTLLFTFADFESVES